MSDEIEALGGLVTAGIAANALDGPRGTGATARHGICANCAAPLAGNFCAACGQKAHLHRSLADVGHEFVHGITHFDGKAWKTLPMLVFRPGTLTRDCIMGKRAKYVAPVPLFLLVLFLTFFVLSFVNIKENAVPIKINAGDTTLGEANKARDLAEIDKNLAAARAIGDADAVEELEASRKFVTTIGNSAANLAGDGEPAGSFADRLADDIARNAERGDVNFNFGVPYFDAKANKALKDPKFVFYKLQNKAYKFSFLLVPLSLPWLWLMFAWKRDVHLYDHAIFALYSISFMSLLFIIGSGALTLNVSSGWLWTALLIAPFVHMYAKLKGAYGLRRFGALWRTVGLSLGAVLSLGIYATLIVALGLMD